MCSASRSSLFCDMLRRRAARRGGRRRRAGARCWSRRPARPAASSPASDALAERVALVTSGVRAGRTSVPAIPTAPPPRSAGLRPGVDGVRRSRRSDALDPRRPDLAVLAVDLHLRPRLPRHRRRAGPTRAAATTARSSPTRPTRSGSRGFADELTPADWQFYDDGHREASKTGADWTNGRRASDGETRPQAPGTVDGACIFLNRAGFAGGEGCALHGLALRTGPQPAGDQAGGLLAAAGAPRAGVGRAARRHPCWCSTIAEFDRRGWGEGGHDLHWWCTSLARGARRRRAAVPLLPRRADRADRRAGLRRTGAAVRAAGWSSAWSPCTPRRRRRAPHRNSELRSDRWNQRSPIWEFRRRTCSPGRGR